MLLPGFVGKTTKIISHVWKSSRWVGVRWSEEVRADYSWKRRNHEQRTESMEVRGVCGGQWEEGRVEMEEMQGFQSQSFKI